MTHRLVAVLLALAVPACLAGTDDKGEESALPEDGGADSFRSPTEHGPIGFVTPVLGELTAQAGYHTWDFTLSGPAALVLATAPPTPTGRKVDTVLYLYREGAGGWGRYLARNDDANGKVWSELRRTLDAGHYRVLVKGYDTTTRGRFAVSAACTGDGCAPPAPTCLLGATYADWRDGAMLWGQRRISDAAELTALERDQVVLAAAQSSHDDVTTAEAALARFDERAVNVVEATTAGTWLVAMEYGAGDNSFGAIFYGNTLELAASIQDGDLYGCTLTPPEGGAGLGQACRADSDCPSSARCRGVTAGFGVCAPLADVPTDGQDCSSDAACGAGALCHGVTRGGGLCGPAWMRGRFDQPAALALADAGETRTHVTSYGLATVDTDVTVHLRASHTDRRQLTIYLRNPAGTEVRVWDGATASAGTSISLDAPVLGFSGDESVNGSWVLRVVDRAAGGTGSLTRWGLTLGSRWD